MSSINNFSVSQFIGGVLLVAGSCVGAGILGMPVLSAGAGFFPSMAVFILCWLLMCTTGLLLLEANLWFDEDISIISMVGKTLGKPGQAVAWFLYLFLFYSLIVSYVSASGVLFSDFVDEIAGLTIPPSVGGALFVFLFGALVFVGTGAVDRFNRLLMFGLVISYLLIVLFGVPHVKRELLQHRDWSAVIMVSPAMVVTFGFHNLVPSLTTYFDHDTFSLRRVIIVGSLVALGFTLLWQWLILGIIPLDGIGGLTESLDNGEIATRALKRVVGADWIVDITEYFAFFAIVTSFLGVVLSLVDFLADGLRVEKRGGTKVFLCGLALLPPFLITLLYPKVFLVALSYAGGFGAVTLFGIFPALIVWRGRYALHLKRERVVPGGRVVLALVVLASLAIVGVKVGEEIGWIEKKTVTFGEQ